VAFEAPFHLQRILAPRQRHLTDRPVARHTANAFLDVDTVIEIDEIGQIIDAIPCQRLATAPTLPYRLQHGTGRMNLRVTGHAGFRRRNAGKSTFLHRGVTVAAVDAELGDVVLVTERHGLLDDDARPGHVRRALKGAEQPHDRAGDENRAEDADLRDRIGAGMKDLRHTDTLKAKFCDRPGLLIRPIVAMPVAGRSSFHHTAAPNQHCEPCSSWTKLVADFPNQRIQDCRVSLKDHSDHGESGKGRIISKKSRGEHSQNHSLRNNKINQCSNKINPKEWRKSLR